MDLSRRALLRLGLLQAGTLAVPRLSEAEVPVAPDRRDTPSILQGATDESRTQFSVAHPEGKAFRARVRSVNGKIWHPDLSESFTMEGQSRALSKYYFSGLHLGENFVLEIEDPAAGVLADRRVFRMFDTSKRQLRFAIASCMDDTRHEPEIWRDMVSSQPDFVLFAGDCTYVDYAGGYDEGPQRLWRRFGEARSTLEIYFSKTLVPIFATWDDHDFGRNDSGREFPYVAESQLNFNRFFAQESSHCSILSRGPGVSSRFVIGGQQFLLMDDRSFRIAGASKDRYAHWGRDQEEWALAQVQAFLGATWIVNGSQIFPQMIFKQSFSGEHPVQFEGLKRALRALDRRVGFISGDVHFSEISEIEEEAFGYRTYELTSSSIHSANIPGTPGLIPNARRIASTGERNYLLVDSVPEGRGCRFRVESRSAGGLVNFSTHLQY